MLTCQSYEARSYEIGDTVILQAEFTDPDNVLVTPSNVTCQIRTPGGTVIALTVTHTGTLYSTSYAVTVSGQHAYRWAADGAATERTFTVEPSVF